MDAIDSVVGALAERPNDALRMLLGLWADGPSAELARIVEGYGRWASGALPPLASTTLSGLEVLWMTVASAGLHTDVERLGAALGRGNNKMVRVRLDTLVRRPPDPRWTPWLVALAGREQRLTSHAWIGWRKLALHGRDPRMLDAVADLRADAVAGIEDEPDYAGWHEARIERLDALVAAFPPPSSPEVGAGALERLAAAVAEVIAGPSPAAEALVPPPTASPVDSLYDAVLEDPSDLDTVRVWADALLDAEDPWGELVALQLQREVRPLTRKEAAQERRLLKRLGPARLGPLATVLDADATRFRRGLLDRALVKPLRKAHEALLRDRAFRTVRHLQSTTDHLLDPGLVSLERVGICFGDWGDGLFPDTSLDWVPAPPLGQLVDLADQPRPLGIVGMAVQQDIYEDVTHLWGLPGLPKLTELRVNGGVADSPLMNAPILARLERLVVHGGTLDPNAVAALWGALRRDRDDDDPAVLVLKGIGPYDTIRLSDGEEGLLVDVNAPRRFRGAVLRALPVARITFHHDELSDPRRPEHVQALPAGAEVVHLDPHGARTG